MSGFERVTRYRSAEDPLNVSGAVIYSNVRCVPQIVPQG